MQRYTANDFVPGLASPAIARPVSVPKKIAITSLGLTLHRERRASLNAACSWVGWRSDATLASSCRPHLTPWRLCLCVQSAARTRSTQRDSQTRGRESACMPWFVVLGVDAMIRYPVLEKRGGLELFGDHHPRQLNGARNGCSQQFIRWELHCSHALHRSTC